MAKQNNRQPEIDPVGAQSATVTEPTIPSATKAPPGLGGPTMPVPPAMPQPVMQEEPKPFGMAEGGLLEEGGLLQEGGTVDKESGNEVPVGSLKEEVRDDIPAKLSEGEFVFPADVVRFIGLERLMQLRQIAKEGLQQMEAMGQMGNSEEATMDDNAEFETEIDDIIEEVEMQTKGEEEEEDVEKTKESNSMAVGGMPSNLASSDSTEDQTMAVLDAGKKRLKPTEIIKKTLEADGFTEKEQSFLKVLVTAVRLGKTSLTQINNTVFTGTHMKDGTFRVHLFTQDSPQMLSGAIKKYTDLLEKAGVEKVSSSTKNTKMISLLRSLGYDVLYKKQGSTYAFTLNTSRARGV